MKNPNRSGNEHLQGVVCRNPATNQTITLSRKAFDSIYRDKGFVEIGRDNTAPAPARTAPAVQVAKQSATGSAAAIAEGLGLKVADAEQVVAGSGTAAGIVAAIGVEEPATDERASNKTDRKKAKPIT